MGGGSNRLPPEGFDAMRVCLNGHVISAYADTRPQFTSPFCDKCGARTISVCQHCNMKIRGAYNSPGAYTLPPKIPPNNCHECGEAYPWRAERIAALNEMIAESERLSADEKAQMTVAVSDLSTDNPRTELGVSRFKRLAKAAGMGAKDANYKFAVDVASETAKKSLEG